MHLLGPHLSGWNLHVAKPNPRLCTAAYWYAKYTAHDPGNLRTILPALFGYRTAQLPGEVVPDLGDPAQSLIEVIRHRGRLPSNATLDEVPIVGHDRASRGEALLSARFSAARLLHASSLCESAEAEAACALFWIPSRERDTYRDPVLYDGRLRSLPQYLIAALRMHDLCAQVSEASVLLRRFINVLPARGTTMRETLHDQGTASLRDRKAAKEHARVCRRRQPGIHTRPGSDVLTEFLRTLDSVASRSTSHHMD